MQSDACVQQGSTPETHASHLESKFSGYALYTALYEYMHGFDYKDCLRNVYVPICV